MSEDVGGINRSIVTEPSTRKNGDWPDRETTKAMWMCSYLAPAYEAELVAKIAAAVVKSLGKMAPRHRRESGL